MSEAALDENMPPIEDEPVITESAETGTETPAESAPASVDNLDPNFIPEDDIGEKTKARINKITADKYAEKRRADALQAQLDEIESNRPALVEPTLEAHDFDDESYNEAKVDYQVQKRLAQIQQDSQQTAQDATKSEQLAAFQAKEVEYLKLNPSYDQDVASLPKFDDDTLHAVFAHDNGPQIAHHLAQNLDVAFEVANMPPTQAAMKLGEIAANLTVKPKSVTTSAASAPIEPIGSSGTLSQDVESMSMDEIYNS